MKHREAQIVVIFVMLMVLSVFTFHPHYRVQGANRFPTLMQDTSTGNRWMPDVRWTQLELTLENLPLFMSLFHHPAHVLSKHLPPPVWSATLGALASQASRGSLLPNGSPILSGKVFKGQMPNEDQPLENVSVELYCSADQDSVGTRIDQTTTNSEGWYELAAGSICNYYNIFANALDGYVHMGSSTVDGVVRSVYWIQYTDPLIGKTLTGNKFWQAPGTNQFTGLVYNGLVGDTDSPLSSVKLELYCSQSISLLGDVIDQTTTNTAGWYELWGHDNCDIYRIRAYNPDWFLSVGASSVGGTVESVAFIRFSGPLTDQDLSGNLFWDKPATLAFSGKVFEGYQPDESTPLPNIDILLFCSESEDKLGSLINAHRTDTEGWYEILGYEGCDYYWIYQHNLDGYISTRASSVDGEIIDRNLIRYQAPLAGLTMTGNRFWDMPASDTFLPLIIH